MPEIELHHHKDSPRWIPLAAAVLAVLAALTGLLANLRVTQSTFAKSDAIVATTRAADAYSEYESRSIKQHVYEAAIAAGSVRDPRPLRLVAAHESSGKEAVLAKARGFEEAARADNERAEHVLASHEILAVATTLFEVAIVLVSIAALVGSRLLPLAAGAATGLGVLVGIAGTVY